MSLPSQVQVHPRAGFAAALILSATGVVTSACSSSQRTARAQTTSAQINAAGSPELRTVDNTGFVGPAGNTRGVSQGMGTTAIGEREGVPPPRRETPSGAVAEGNTQAPPSTPIVTSPSDPAEAIERASRAMCDRDTYCERIGPDRAYGSADECMSDRRGKIQKSAPAKVCVETISGERLGACLTAIRNVTCDALAGVSPAECSPAALCR